MKKAKKRKFNNPKTLSSLRVFAFVYFENETISVLFSHSVCRIFASKMQKKRKHEDLTYVFTHYEAKK